MSKLLDYLNALDTSAVVIEAHKKDPLQATRDFGLSVDEQVLILRQDRREISAFLDLPFKDFDAIDSIETLPSLDAGQTSLKNETELIHS
ncbi:hypothetical protein [Undibacterium sp. TC9W]|uniref:hypothetical protein n=1 Tax=Undibacterium sp. TC9W TaxID=3413053 RepID=UPI003BF13719